METTTKKEKVIVEKIMIDITFTFGIDELKEQFFGHQEEEEYTIENVKGWKVRGESKVVMIEDKVGNIKANVENADKIEMVVYGQNDTMKKEYEFKMETENQLYFVVK